MQQIKKLIEIKISKFQNFKISISKILNQIHSKMVPLYSKSSVLLTKF